MIDNCFKKVCDNYLRTFLHVVYLKSFFACRPAFFFCNNDDPESSDAAPMPPIKFITASISAPSRRPSLSVVMWNQLFSLRKSIIMLIFKNFKTSFFLISSFIMCLVSRFFYITGQKLNVSWWEKPTGNLLFLLFCIGLPLYL